MSDVTYTYELGKEIPKDVTHVVIPNEIEEIDEHDFLWCQDNLKSVMCKNGEIVENIKDAICMFEYYKGELGEFYYNPDEFEIQSSIAYQEILTYVGEEFDGSKITIPSGLVEAHCMFCDCTNLTKAPVIPESVQNCEGMFSDCTNLTEPPVIPESVEFCRSMFQGCENLTEAPVVPKSVKYCKDMFSECINLTEAPVIPDGVKDCAYMFYECENLKEVSVIPESVTNCRNMFKGCTNLVKAPVIPEGVENCKGMFKGCSEEVQKAGQWNIEHRGLDYYADGSGNKSTKREIPDVDDAEDDSIGKGLGE